MFSALTIAALASVAIAQCDTVDTGYQCDTAISHQWGQYSPYFSVPSNISADTPSGCSISFVNVLSRHGSRFPTAKKTALYSALIQQIHNQATSYSQDYAFIQNYNYTLGADDLTLFGQQEMINSGIKFFERYQSLTNLSVPFYRSSGDGRVVESAQNFSQGFNQARGCVDPSYQSPILVISEDSTANNTLHASLCTDYENGPNTQINGAADSTWLSTWITPVKTRVNNNLPGANLSKTQIIYLMDLCPFNTVATLNGTISPFCNLFTTTEWSYYDYYRSVDKFYADMQGNPLGPTQGVGFGAELLARMTSNRTYVQDSQSYTSINHTLDDSQSTFPLGSSAAPLYADFSHDDDLASIFSALGLYNQTAPLSNTTYESTSQTNGYSAAWVVPFASRAYFEKMVCSGESEELVRVIINDRVVPLQNCGADALGRCTLSAFVGSQSFVQAGGLWGQCFV